MENLVSRSSQTEWLPRVRGLLSQLIYWGSSSIADSITNPRLLQPHTVLWSANTQSLLLHMITHYFLSLAGRRGGWGWGGWERILYLDSSRHPNQSRHLQNIFHTCSADSPSKERLRTRHPKSAATRFWEDKVCLKSPCGYLRVCEVPVCMCFQDAWLLSSLL